MLCSHVCHHVYSTKVSISRTLPCAVRRCAVLWYASLPAHHCCTVNLAAAAAAAHTTCYMIRPSIILLPSIDSWARQPLPPTARPYASLTSLLGQAPRTLTRITSRTHARNNPHSTSPLCTIGRIVQCSSSSSSAHHHPPIEQTSPGTLQPLVSLQPRFHPPGTTLHPLHYCTAAFPLLTSLLTTLP